MPDSASSCEPHCKPSDFWQYPRPLVEGRLVKRYKRFFADVVSDSGQELTLHCPNTGSMRELLAEGARVRYLLASPAELKKRKTPGTLEQIKTTAGHWVGVNTHRANHIVGHYLHELIKHQSIETVFTINNPIITSEVSLHSEVSLKKLLGVDQEAVKSRIDFMLKSADTIILIEVKSVTYLNPVDQQGYFPDAVSARASRQIEELLLAQLKPEIQVVVLYLIQHEGITTVQACETIDPQYAYWCGEAKSKGVQFKQLHTSYTANNVSVYRDLL